MLGDRLVIKKEHVKAARGIIKLLLPRITGARKYIVTIAGESGSGKSEIASVLSESLIGKNIQSIIIQQDDYFIYPPITNAGMRRNNINHVGLTEVRIDLIDRNLEDFKDGKEKIIKPLVIFEENSITEETIDLRGIDVVIVEGTYTTTLENADMHVFIDRTFHDTREARMRRAREEQDEFLEEVLEIEHGIISSHKRLADVIVTRNYDVKENNGKKE